MGASKRLAEMAIQTQAMGSGTSFAIVRFGNVLGSNGSVVPRFLEQIRKGGPVTVTHPDMRRFFMLIPEAVQLVLHAASQAESGGTYVLEMGEQVKLVDMARDLIRLAGFVPDEEIAIAFTGLRPGEKLYEELVGINEVAGPSRIEKIHRVTSRTPPDPEFFKSLEGIERQAAEGDVKAVRALVEDAHSRVPATPLKSRRFRRRCRSKRPPRSMRPNSMRWRTAKGTSCISSVRAAFRPGCTAHMRAPLSSACAATWAPSGCSAATPAAGAAG